MRYLGKKERLLVAASHLQAMRTEHPSASGVRVGCDCGCGGEDITEEDWVWYDSALKEAEEAFNKLCEELGIYE